MAARSRAGFCQDRRGGRDAGRRRVERPWGIGAVTLLEMVMRQGKVAVVVSSGRLDPSPPGQEEDARVAERCGGGWR